jgi:hypothetical protein
MTTKIRMPLSGHEMDYFGGFVEIPRWLFDLDLSPGATKLFVHVVRESFRSGDLRSDRQGWEVTITPEWAIGVTGVKQPGYLMNELLRVGALTLLRRHRDNSLRIQWETYPPRIRDVLAGRLDRSDVPELQGVENLPIPA